MSAGKTDQIACPECGSRKVQRQLSHVAGLSSGGGIGSSSSASCAPGGG
jgi:hypothetical protein